MTRQRLRHALAAAAIALAVSPAALAVLAEASQSRMAAFLEEIRAAQERTAFAGRRAVTRPEGSAVHDIRSERPRRYHVEAVSPPQGRRPIPWMARTPRGRFGDPALIADNYHLVARGGETVAGRDADRYALLPRRPGRASYEFSVDRRNRFLLAYRAVAPDGARLYDARYESIVFDPPAREKPPAKPAANRPSPERPRRVIRQDVTEAQLRGALPFTAWLPAWTPPGFRLKSLERFAIRDLGEAILGRWSDGMTWIYVMQTDAANPAWELFRGAYLGLPESPPAATQGGGPVAWRMRTPGGALLDLTLDGTEILIGGQVDPDELKKVADHLRKIEN